MNVKENWYNLSGYRTGLDRITISISMEMNRSWHLERAPEINKLDQLGMKKDSCYKATLYLSGQAERESFVRAVIEHSKISLESYKKIQIMKLTVITN
jgi:hypothetical protein